MLDRHGMLLALVLACIYTTALGAISSNFVAQDDPVPSDTVRIIALGTGEQLSCTRLVIAAFGTDGPTSTIPPIKRGWAFAKTVTKFTAG